MFDKFGPLTYEELNKTAEGLKMEGDIESLILLAEENGLEKEDAEDYADEVVDTFTTPVEAAIGKIKVESEYLNLAQSTTLSGMRDLIAYTVTQNEKLQTAAHDQEKSLAKCLGKLVAEASRTRYKLPDEIAIAAGIPTVYMGDVSKERAKERDKQLAAQSAQQRAEEMEQLKNGTERNRQLFDLLMNDLMEVGA